MPLLSSCLTRPLRWLRAGYPARAPRYGHVPLIALMSGPAPQPGNLPDADDLPVLLSSPHKAPDAQRQRT
jgi:hypothetical protein